MQEYASKVVDNLFQTSLCLANHLSIPHMLKWLERKKGRADVHSDAMNIN